MIAILSPCPLSLLDEARELLTLGYFTAAATVARSALEAWAFAECDRIGYVPMSRRAWKLPGRIDGLFKLGVIDATQRHHAYVALEVGCAAAHGRPIDRARVRCAVANLRSVVEGGGV